MKPGHLEGQVRGGVTQGLGVSLTSALLTTTMAGFLAGTSTDYLLPRTTGVPTIEIDHLEMPPISPRQTSVTSAKGGAICAPAALTNAIEDVLSPVGVKITEQYLPPGRILQLTGAI